VFRECRDEDSGHARPRPGFQAAWAVRAIMVGLLALVVLGAAGSGCVWRRVEMVPPLEGEPVVVGIPLPLSGAKAAFGEAKRNAYQLAADQVNAEGGLDGRPLALVFRDTAGDPATAAEVGEELIAEGATLLIGEFSSGCALALAAVAQRLSVPYLVDSAAADAITQQKSPYVFRLNPPAGLLAQGLESFLTGVVHPRSLAIVYERSDYGSSCARAMREWCRRNGVTVPVFEAYEPGALDFGPLLERVGQASPDVLYMVSYLVDASLLVRQARAKALSVRLLAGAGGGFVLPEFVESAGQAAENVVSAAVWAPTLGYPGAAVFAETYRARFGRYPGHHAAEAYAAIEVVADALRRAASTEPDRVREALAATELMTVLGPVRFENFEKYRNQNRLQTVVLQVRNGAYEVIWPPEAATAEPLFPDPLAGGD